MWSMLAVEAPLAIRPGGVRESAHLLSALRVAVLLAGPPDLHVTAEIDGALQLKQHVIDPLLPVSAVGVFVAATNLAGWKRQHLRKLVSPSTVVVAEEPGRLLPRRLTRFRDEWFKHVQAYDRWAQYGHVRQAFELMARYERLHSIEVAFVIKTRIDLYYKPDHFFCAGWLHNLSDSNIATSATEFHCADRWVDRTDDQPTSCFTPNADQGPTGLVVGESPLRPFLPGLLGKTWPHQMADQLILGRRAPMEVVLKGMFVSAPTRNTSETFWRAWPFWNTIEAVMAEHAIASNIEVVAFELQFRVADRLSLCFHGCPPMQPSDCALWVPGRCRRCRFQQQRPTVAEGSSRENATAMACREQPTVHMYSRNRCLLRLLEPPTQNADVWECKMHNSWFVDLHWQPRCVFANCSDPVGLCQERRNEVANYCGVHRQHVQYQVRVV